MTLFAVDVLHLQNPDAISVNEFDRCTRIERLDAIDSDFCDLGFESLDTVARHPERADIRNKVFARKVGKPHQPSVPPGRLVAVDPCNQTPKWKGD